MHREVKLQGQNLTASHGNKYYSSKRWHLSFQLPFTTIHQYTYVPRQKSCVKHAPVPFLSILTPKHCGCEIKRRQKFSPSKEKAQSPWGIITEFSHYLNGAIFSYCKPCAVIIYSAHELGTELFNILGITFLIHLFIIIKVFYYFSLYYFGA